MHAATTERARLRLVRPPAERETPVARPEQAPRSPALEPTDPRWVLAVRVAYMIQGGRAAILRPADRRHLHRLASYMGIKPFDANLVIAIVQDAARSGDASSARVRLGPEVADRLVMLRVTERPARTERPTSPFALLLASSGVAAVLAAAAIRWIG